MKLATYEHNGDSHIGLVLGPGTEILPICEAERNLLGTELLPDSLLAFIKQTDPLLPVLRALEGKLQEQPYETLRMEQVKLLAPIPRPTKNIFCVGLNYREHVEETGKVIQANEPQYPIFFSKAPTSVTGPDSVVKNFPGVVTQIDYEAELAVIIGKQGLNIKKEAAYEHIFGYTIINDVSARDLQFRHSQWLLGKSCDTFAPMGPWLVHKAALPNPQKINIACKINGEIRQNNNTRNMIFDIPTLIETISSVVTLEPGDIIATGTPSGVGLGFNPPKFLQSGDVMEISIEGIGVLRNTIE